MNYYYFFFINNRFINTGWKLKSGKKGGGDHHRRLLKINEVEKSSCGTSLSDSFIDLHLLLYSLFFSDSYRNTCKHIPYAKEQKALL